ncbi:cytochrome b-c1 complex subunit 9 [Apiospora arundinis]
MENPSTLPNERERDQELADLRGANLFVTKKLLNAYASSNEQKKAREERDTELDLLRWKVSYLQGTVTCLDETLMREHALRRELEKQPNDLEANLELAKQPNESEANLEVSGK